MKPGELAIGGGVTALGLCYAISTYLLPEAGGYAQVGPGVFPAIVSAGLLICGALLLAQAASGGFRNRAEEDTDPFDWRAFGWVSGGILVHLALIGTIGFVAASVILFLAIARGFGSTNWQRDAIVALVMAVLLYLLFTEILGLALGPTFASLIGRA
jgi:putative tricarboxylic transport membrane protein